MLSCDQVFANHVSADWLYQLLRAALDEGQAHIDWIMTSLPHLRVSASDAAWIRSLKTYKVVAAFSGPGLSLTHTSANAGWKPAGGENIFAGVLWSILSEKPGAIGPKNGKPSEAPNPFDCVSLGLPSIIVVVM